MRKKLALVVNNDRFNSSQRIEELERVGFEVRFCGNTSSVYDFLRNSAQRPDIVITGIQLPHGEEFTVNETEGGMKTGIALYNSLRSNLLMKFPIVVISSSVKYFDKLGRLGDKKLVILNSLNTSAKDLARIAIGLVSDKS